METSNTTGAVKVTVTVTTPEIAAERIARWKIEDAAADKRYFTQSAHAALASACAQSFTAGVRTREFYRYMELMGKAGLGFDAADWAAREAVESNNSARIDTALSNLRPRWN